MQEGPFRGGVAVLHCCMLTRFRSGWVHQDSNRDSCGLPEGFRAIVDEGVDTSVLKNQQDSFSCAMRYLHENETWWVGGLVAGGWLVDDGWLVE